MRAPDSTPPSSGRELREVGRSPAEPTARGPLPPSVGVCTSPAKAGEVGHRKVPGEGPDGLPQSSIRTAGNRGVRAPKSAYGPPGCSRSPPRASPSPHRCRSPALVAPARPSAGRLQVSPAASLRPLQSGLLLPRAPAGHRDRRRAGLSPGCAPARSAAGGVSRRARHHRAAFRRQPGAGANRRRAGDHRVRAGDRAGRSLSAETGGRTARHAARNCAPARLGRPWPGGAQPGRGDPAVPGPPARRARADARDGRSLRARPGGLRPVRLRADRRAGRHRRRHRHPRLSGSPQRAQAVGALAGAPAGRAAPAVPVSQERTSGHRRSDGGHRSAALRPQAARLPDRRRGGPPAGRARPPDAPRPARRRDDRGAVRQRPPRLRAREAAAARPQLRRRVSDGDRQGAQRAAGPRRRGRAGRRSRVRRRRPGDVRGHARGSTRSSSRTTGAR